jgi:hypothetical protein
LLLAASVVAAVAAMAPGCASSAWSWTASAPPGRPESGFTDVSCPSPSWCMAIGFRHDIEAQRSAVIAATYDGASWTSLPDVPLDPTANLFLDLREPRVDCAAAGSCAVAITVHLPGIDRVVVRPVLARWDGGAWAVDTSWSDGWSAAENVFVDDVACGSPSACLAVGFVAAGEPSAFAAGWDGTSWSRRPAPAAGPYQLAGGLARARVTCTTASQCVSLVATAPTPGRRDSVQAWDGGSWTSRPVPFATLTGGLAQDVDCVSASACTAVGVTVTPLPCTGDPLCGRFPPPVRTRAVAATWDGVGWTTRALPVPVQELRPTTGAGAVSCLSASTCLAAPAGAGPGPVAAVQAWARRGGTWVSTTGPETAAGAGVHATGVSCSSTGCLVVGWQQSREGSRVPMAYRVVPSGPAP